MTASDQNPDSLSRGAPDLVDEFRTMNDAVDDAKAELRERPLDLLAKIELRLGKDGQRHQAAQLQEFREELEQAA